MNSEILLPALIAGLLVLSTHVPLGQEVLKRGIIFIDLTLAQIAGLGLIIAHSIGWETHGWEEQLIAIIAALSGATLLAWTEKHFKQHQEALIGSLFVITASLGILFLAHNPHGGEHLKDLLVGQILWVETRQLWIVAIFYALILGSWWYFTQHREKSFYFIFALAITASVQLVGVYLVFASLIMPALATSNLKVGYIIGGIGYGLGLIIAHYLDLPAGAVIVLILAICSVIASLFRKTITH
jgi:zinc/manganese transport system permease protein